jgi:hypothetical protein
MALNPLMRLRLYPPCAFLICRDHLWLNVRHRRAFNTHNGWLIVGIAFVTMAIGVTARTAFSLLMPPLIDEFRLGVDRRGVPTPIGEPSY